VKAILGFLAVVLGALGLVVAVVAGIAVWWAAGIAAAEARELTKKADTGLVKIEVALDQLVEATKRTQTTVDKVRRGATKIASGRLNDNPVLRAKFDDLLTTLAPVLLQAESLGQSFESIAFLLNTTAQLGERFGKAKSKVEQIRSAADSLQEAAEVLGEIRQKVVDIQEGRAVPSAQTLADMATKAKPALAKLAVGLERAHEESQAAHEALPTIRAKVEFWAVAGPAIVTGLLLWFALGQLCLVACGWQMMTAQATPT
jgi:hypothetical protein